LATSNNNNEVLAFASASIFAMEQREESHPEFALPRSCRGLDTFGSRATKQMLKVSNRLLEEM
jgi:hypothetical protein